MRPDRPEEVSTDGLTHGYCDTVSLHVGIGGSVEYCHVVTPTGSGTILTTGKGVGIGGSISGGAFVSNAKCVDDLAGPFVEVGGGAGAVVVAGGSYAEGFNSENELIWMAQANVGLGAEVKYIPVGGSASKTNTRVIDGGGNCGCS